MYPSFSEGFGFPPLEAMSLGCPVLASRIPATMEVCHEAPFYFEPEEQGSFNRELLRGSMMKADSKNRSAEARKWRASTVGRNADNRRWPYTANVSNLRHYWERHSFQPRQPARFFVRDVAAQAGHELR